MKIRIKNDWIDTSTANYEFYMADKGVYFSYRDKNSINHIGIFYKKFNKKNNVIEIITKSGYRKFKK